MNQIAKNGKNSCRWMLMLEEKVRSTVKSSLGFKCLRPTARGSPSKSAICKQAQGSSVWSLSSTDVSRARGTGGWAFVSSLTAPR